MPCDEHSRRQGKRSTALQRPDTHELAESEETLALPGASCVGFAHADHLFASPALCRGGADLCGTALALRLLACGRFNDIFLKALES